MQLYGTLTSPYVRKLRILIIEKAIACEFVALPAASDPRVAELNPLAKVPVLVRDDGEPLFDSPMIADYLDTLTAPALIPSSGEARFQVQRWHALSQGILDSVVMRMMEGRKPEGERSQKVIEREQARIERVLDWAEARVTGPGPLAVGALTLADFVLAVALEYADFRYTRDWRITRPTLAAWLAPMSHRPAFNETRPT